MAIYFSYAMKKIIILLSLATINLGANSQISKSSVADNRKVILKIVQNDTSISVFKNKGKELILAQISKKDIRPYIHPVIAPDGNGLLTQMSPSHHLHQTGIYWGLKMVNGRDFFMNWKGDYYRRVAANVIKKKGQEVKWQTVYDLLDENGNTCLTETFNWTLQERNGKYLLDLEWRGEAKTDITFGEFYVGGLFIRMPWTRGIPGEIINAVGQRNRQEAEAQRAIWADIGVQIEGRTDWGHIAILDHPANDPFPTPWRVDGQLGLGPSKQILGDWKLDKGEIETFRFRLVIYTGNLNPDQMKQEWIRFVRER